MNPLTGVGVGHYFQNCHFGLTNFSNASADAVYVDCDFEKAKFRNTNIHEASFIRCNMLSSDFRNASMGMEKRYSTYFGHCDLTGASFGSTSGLNEADDPPGITGCLEGVRFVACKLERIDWGGADLSKAEFLPSDSPPVHI